MSLFHKRFYLLFYNYSHLTHSNCGKPIGKGPTILWLSSNILPFILRIICAQKRKQNKNTIIKAIKKTTADKVKTIKQNRLGKKGVDSHP